MTTTLDLCVPASLPDFSALGCTTEGNHQAWAVFSNDRMYRYMLARMWDDYFEDNAVTRPLMVFGMLNPSSAGAFRSDPTIRKCVGFAERYKCGGIVVVNAAALVSTDPKGLRDVADPIGPHNARMIDWAFGAPILAIRVCAWGRVEPRVRRRLLTSMGNIKAHAHWCFGKTKDGEPRHPLMLAYDTPLVHMADGRVWT
jgi:hypothetical protein